MNSLVFTAGVQKNKWRVGHACFFATERIWEDRYSRLKNQSASIDARGYSDSFFVSEHGKKNKSGWLGVNKRNRGYSADFEFIERPLIEKIKK